MDGGTLTENWSIDGRSSAQGATSTGQGVLLADVTGDEHFELLVAGRDISGEATLTATRDGSSEWTTVFDGFQGWYPQWNENGLLTWTAGKYRGGPKDDIAVGLRQSSMHSDETQLLDGATGQSVWTRDELWQPFVEPQNNKGRGAGGSFATTMDINLDNRDELMIHHSDGIAYLKGESGQSLQEKWSTQIYGEQTFFAQGVEFPGNDNIPRLAMFDGSHGFGVFDANLDEVWTVGDGSAEDSSGVLADVDGNDISELVVVGDDGRSSIVAYNTDGSRRWTYNTHLNQVMAVSADIDNDGKDEIVYARDNQLVAIEEHNGSPVEKWVWNSPNGSFLETPSLGDVDEDGDLEIVLFDGRTLYILGNTEPAKIPDEPQFRLVSDRFEAGAIKLPWTNTAFATGYSLVIATDIAFTEVAHEIEFNRRQLAYTWTFAPGEYWLRLVANNPQGTRNSQTLHLLIGESGSVLTGIFTNGFE
jgi:hypothetical protein